MQISTPLGELESESVPRSSAIRLKIDCGPTVVESLNDESPHLEGIFNDLRLRTRSALNGKSRAPTHSESIAHVAC